MVIVTKLGKKQRLIIALIRHDGALAWSQIQKKTGLEASQLNRALKALVEAKALVHCWDGKGRAVYRLPEKSADVS
jgi:DNA-binding IclR family transcriptional regulator